MNKRAIVRSVGWCLGSMFLAGGISSFVRYRHHTREFDAAQIAEPMRIPVDFSQTNHYSAGFIQTFSRSHGEVIWLETGLSITNETDARLLIQGLRGRFKITGETNQVVIHEEFSANTFSAHSGLRPGEIDFKPAFSFVPFRKGAYRLDLVVDAGAPALRGVRQHLVARYELCGLERLPATIAAVLAAVCALLGAGTLGGLFGTRARCSEPQRATDATSSA